MFSVFSAIGGQCRDSLIIHPPLPAYFFSSSMQKTKAWKRKKMIMGRVMRWMTTHTTVPSTSDSTAPELTFFIGFVRRMSHWKWRNQAAAK